MTIIAYRDGVMAADSACTMGPVITGSVPKIWKEDGALFGFCGACGWETYLRGEIVRPLVSGNFPEPYVYERLPNGITALIVLPSGRFCEVAKSQPWEQIEAQYIAIGSAFELAYGAFHHGASAEEAVAACIAHGQYIRGPVQTVRLG